MTESEHQPDSGAEDIPLGLVVAQTAKALDRALDNALTLAGGNRPTWLILEAVASGAGRVQSTLADQVGISAPTLVYHLDRLETAGVVHRIRGVENRRIQAIELTDAGNRLFRRLREAATGFDHQLRSGLDADAVGSLVETLHRLAANVSGPTSER